MAEKGLSDHGKKVGTAVSAISATIIVFVASGAEFLGEGSSIVGTVIFAHPEIVKLSVFILYLYWLYRLCVVTWNPWKNFKKMVLKELRHDEKLWNHVNDIRDKVRKDLHEKNNLHKYNQELINRVIPALDPYLIIEWVKDEGNAITFREKKILAGIKFRRPNTPNQIWQQPFEISKSIFWRRFIIVSLKRDHIFTIIVPWLMASSAFPFAIYEFYKYYSRGV